MKIIDQRGWEFDFKVLIKLMDDDLYEELYGIISPCTEQEFYDAYCSAHEKKFSEEFTIN